MRQPLVVSYGMGVDSTAMLVGLAQRGIRPDAILFADTAAEKDETYAYLDQMNAWLEKVGFPKVTVVEYVVQNFKNWPPYQGLEENCLTNGTLPSEAFGFGSCSQKWKQVPQNKWCESWAPAAQAWAAGLKVRKAIGYDASPADEKRACAAKRTFKVAPDERYDYWYPLQDWGWDRARCIREIAAVGLFVPVKSSCFFCPNMTTGEVDQLSKEKLARIVIMEARAKPRLEGWMTQAELDARYAAQAAAYEARGRKGKAPRRKTEGEQGLVKGLWRSGCKGTRGGEKKPARMTEFILERGLLSAATVARLEALVPKELVLRNEAHARGEKVESWDDFMTRVLVDLN